MTLGQMIGLLQKLPEDFVFPYGLRDGHSWRGHYTELAFEAAGEMTALEILKEAKYCVDETFTGYKGGDFKMTPDTPVHIDAWGDYSGGRAEESWMMDNLTAILEREAE